MSTTNEDALPDSSLAVHVVIHVPNVWQTSEWYQQVFGFSADVSSDVAFAHLSAGSYQLTFAAHTAQQFSLGPRRLNSFLADPPALHLAMTTANVQALFSRALAHGAVPVVEPGPDGTGRLAATLRDLNGILIRLISPKSEPADSN